MTRILRVGIGGPVGSGKSMLIERVVPILAKKNYRVCIISNDVISKEDADRINGKTFNFGFENHKVIDIAKIIQSELSDLNVEIEVTETQDHRDYHISSQKILNELGYQPISSIKKEVADLRKAIEGKQFSDIDDPTYYNMQSMEMNRVPSCYDFLSR